MTARPTAPPSPSTPAGQSLGAMPCYASSCGRVTLYLGDSLEIAPMLQGVDALISDPPYGIDYSPDRCRAKPRRKNAAIFNREWEKVGGDDVPFDPSPWLGYSVAVIWGGNNYTDKLPNGGWLVWNKQRAKGFVGSGAEMAWTNTINGAQIFDLMWDGFRRGAEVNEHYHPTQKPVSLMAWCMDKAKVPEGATVLDPYMGSGSTGIACIRTGRRFIGIEKDPTHYATALERITNELRQGDLFHSQHNTPAQEGESLS